jgi:hypothetical protein
VVTGSEPTIRLMWSLFTSPKRPLQAEKGETLPDRNEGPAQHRHQGDDNRAVASWPPVGCTARLPSAHLQRTTESKITRKPSLRIDHLDSPDRVNLPEFHAGSVV